MPDNDAGGLGSGDGMLTQDALDALLAAAAAEGQLDEEAAMEAYTEAAAERNEPFGSQIPHAAPHVPPPPAHDPAVVSLPSFEPPSRAAAPAPTPDMVPVGSLGRVRDIPLEVSVELGRTRLLIRDILELGPGSIIELDKIAGEPVDLFANGMLVARGEVVVIDDNFGVRVTEIITAAERSKIAEAEAIAA